MTHDTTLNTLYTIIPCNTIWRYFIVGGILQCTIWLCIMTWSIRSRHTQSTTLSGNTLEQSIMIQECLYMYVLVYMFSMCSHMWMYVHLRIHAQHAYTHASCFHVHVNVYIYVYMLRSPDTTCIRRYIRVCYTHWHTHGCVLTYICTYVQRCMHVSANV